MLQVTGLYRVFFFEKERNMHFPTLSQAFEYLYMLRNLSQPRPGHFDSLLHNRFTVSSSQQQLISKEIYIELYFCNHSPQKSKA